MSTTSRVIKNTSFLYIRMGITVLVSLYSTRLILASLGEVDFGIFNVIGGSIAMMGFLNSTLANATQRFMSFAEGKGDLNNKKKIFNVSIVLHLLIALATVILLVIIMPLLFDKLLTIPPSRVLTAKIVYITLIFSAVITVINVPYDAVLNAHENMLYYAVIGVIEAFIKLGIAFACVYSKGNRLLLYSILMAILPVITFTIMKWYCQRSYPECVISLKKYWDRNVVKSIAKFSGWNFLTAISSLFTVQGLSVVLNHFFGAVLNAAQGIAAQVNGQLSAFSINMMKALNPVIIKRTANSDSYALRAVTYSGCKFSALLTLFFAVPVVVKMNYILSVWLEEVPRWTVIFCQLQLVQTVILQLANPLSTAVYGRGEIKGYAICKSIMNILPLFFSVIAFHFNGTPVWLYITLIMFMGIGGNCVIVFYAKKKCDLSVKEYFQNVIIPILDTVIIMLLFTEIVRLAITDSNMEALILCCLSSTLGLLISMCTVGLSQCEKQIIWGLIIKLFPHKK